MSSWIKQIVRASPDRSDRSWIVATAAHLTPVLITRVYLQQFVFKTSHQIKKIALCQQRPRCQNLAAVHLTGSTHLMLSFKWQPPAKVHNPEVKGTAGPQY